MNKPMYAKMITLAVIGFFTWSIQGCHSSAANTLVKRDPEKAVKVRTQLAAEYIRAGDLDAAKRALDQAFTADSKDSGANMMMGVLLQKEGSPTSLEQADRYFKRAIGSDPKNAQARNNYGTYLFQQQRYPEAIAQFKIAGAALGYDQRYVALENLGRVYLSLDDVTLAEKTFKQALQVNRDSSISMLQLAELLYLQQKFSEAGPFYTQFVRLTGAKNQSAAALWLGIRLARANGDEMGMQVLINQLRALFPDSQEYQRFLQLQYSTEAVWK